MVKPTMQTSQSQWVQQLQALGIGIFAMSDTVGVSNPENIPGHLFRI
jgi:hypothetical protein